jgi:hypothetical protein
MLNRGWAARLTRRPVGSDAQELLAAWGAHNGSYPTLLAGDPGSGRLALNCHSKGGLWVVDGDPAHLLCRTSSGEQLASACFDGPDRLVTSARRSGVQMWRLDGGRLELAASAQIRTGWSGPVVIPESGTVAVIDHDTETVKLLDMETLETLAEICELPEPASAHVWGPAAGRYLVLGTSSSVDVVDTARCLLADRPLAAMTTTDLALTADLLSDPAAAAAARPFLELLRDVLSYRFADEVALGGGAPAASEADDIALSAGGDGSC